MKKAALAALVVTAVALAACSKTDSPSPASDKKPAATKPAGVAKPTMPDGSPPPAPELKFDAAGKPIIPQVVAPAPPKPAGGPQAPGLSPEALKAAKEALAKSKGG